MGTSSLATVIQVRLMVRGTRSMQRMGRRPSIKLRRSNESPCFTGSHVWEGKAGRALLSPGAAWVSVCERVCECVCTGACVHACIHLRISSSLSASHPSLGRTWVLSVLRPQALSWPGWATQAMHSVLATGGLQECEGVGWRRWRRSRLPGSSTESLLWQSHGHPPGPAIPSFPHKGPTALTRGSESKGGAGPAGRVWA